MKSKTEYEEVMLYINKWRYDHQAPDSEVLSRLCGWLDAKIEAKSE